jgi:hypothetical protein
MKVERACTNGRGLGAPQRPAQWQGLDTAGRAIDAG